MSNQTALRDAEAVSHERRRRRGVLLVPVTVLVLLALVVGYHLWPVSPPYPASALHLTLVSLELVPGDQAQGRVDSLTGPGRLQVPAGLTRLLVGQVAYDVPAGAGTSTPWSFFLLGADGSPVRTIFGATPSGPASAGWDSSYGDVAPQVPALHGLAPVPDGSGGFTNPGSSLSVIPTTAGPLTFVAIPRDDAVEPATAYTVWTALQTSDSALLWAVEVPRPTR